MVRPHAPPLPAPDRLTVWPGATIAGADNAAIGRSAAESERAALAIPAPQVLVVQLHSLVCKSFCRAGIRHIGTAGSADTGNGVVAPSRKRAISCSEPRLPFAPAMSPAMPATIGAEKLVPTLTLVWFV